MKKMGFATTSGSSEAASPSSGCGSSAGASSSGCNSPYSGSIAAGETQDLVLVAELQEEKAQSIQSISLLMRNAEEGAYLFLMQSEI